MPKNLVDPMYEPAQFPNFSLKCLPPIPRRNAKIDQMKNDAQSRHFSMNILIVYTLMINVYVSNSM